MRLVTWVWNGTLGAIASILTRTHRNPLAEKQLTPIGRAALSHNNQVNEHSEWTGLLRGRSPLYGRSTEHTHRGLPPSHISHTANTKVQSSLLHIVPRVPRTFAVSPLPLRFLRRRTRDIPALVLDQSTVGGAVIRSWHYRTIKPNQLALEIGSPPGNWHSTPREVNPPQPSIRTTLFGNSEGVYYRCKHRSQTEVAPRGL